MKKKIHNYQLSHSFFVATISIFLMLGLGSITLANGTITKTSVNNVILIIVICLGGLISVFGITMVFRGIGGKSDVDLTLSKKIEISFKKISQGVVVIIIGALILLGALYIGREKETASGKTIIIEEDKVMELKH